MVTVKTSFRTLMCLAHKVGQAKESGDEMLLDLTVGDLGCAVKN